MITITLTPQTPVQISAALKFLEQLSGSAFVESSPQVEAPEVKTEAKKRKPAQEVAQEVTQEAMPSPAAEPAAPAPEVKPKVALEDVRKKLAALSHEGKAAQVKALLTNFGASKLTDVPAERYAELLAAAEGI
jgi:hypothetical protein